MGTLLAAADQQGGLIHGHRPPGPVTSGYLLFLGLTLWKELPRLFLSRDRSEAVFIGILAGKPAATGQRC